MSMIGIVICTFIVCVAVVICVLGWKYLDEQDDLSYPRFDAKDNENGGRS